MEQKPAKFRAALVWTAAILAVLGLLLPGCFFILPPSLSRKEWIAARAALEAKGEKLSLSDFPRKKVRDEDNFYADPIWRELSDREKVKAEIGFVYRPRLEEKKRQLYIFNRSLDVSEVKALEKEFPAAAGSIPRDRELPVMKAIWSKLAKDPAQRRRAAEYIRRSQPPVEPLIARLHELSRRPEASFPWQNRDSYFINVEHAQALSQIGKWLEFRISAMLELGDYREAFRDSVLIFRLIEVLRRDRFLYSFQVELSLATSLTNVIDSGIGLHAWTAAELRAFDGMLAELDLPGGLAEALRVERAMMLDLVWPAFEDGSIDDFMPVPYSYPGPIRGLYRAIWTSEDKTVYCELAQQNLESLDLVSKRGVNAANFPNRWTEYLKTHSSLHADFSKKISRSFIFPQTALITRAARAQTFVLLTRVAIALELYRMEHGEYPESLDAVGSFFPGGVPLDIITLSPFHYQRNEDDGFSLWSVGWNGTDEMGRIEERLEFGDWAWGD